ncbi:anthranilate phosphoribosyltransferase [Halalkalibacter sp. APA_J-10(15)]|uniref:anthranilate phosphoribosyltransferase n=1 Tax=unclassified Halalkalibacter TaxID=2893063 RepID=UPI001FF4DAA5|nr:anthranilate phosphoribosyltransferase [Halalkalibacter sp. APA_J-10(15)]MCK0472116.1 anthranilate phosphoribosyltransferase [Halalkalibacter sp. APA_J-10(15)]
MLKDVLRHCMNHETLSTEQAEQVMNEIMSGHATPSQIASLLTILRFRGETVEEMIGFVRAMRSHSVSINTQGVNVIDTCGTGGDNLGTFNISTATAIVLSGLSVPVAKHGNRAVSSRSGSADVLEELSIPIQHSVEQASRSLQDYNLCFLFAPLYHQSMKHAVTPRKEIGFRTIFNFLGPMTNPANAKRQLIGVSDFEYAKKMANTLLTIGTERTLFVTGRDGLDELSITTESDLIEVAGNTKKEYTISPEEMGLKRGSLHDIQVDTPLESAELIRALLKGEANESATSIVALNAGAALYVYGKVSTIKEGVHQAQAALSSGQIDEHYKALQKGATESA